MVEITEVGIEHLWRPLSPTQGCPGVAGAWTATWATLVQAQHKYPVSTLRPEEKWDLKAGAIQFNEHLDTEGRGRAARW